MATPPRQQAEERDEAPPSAPQDDEEARDLSDSARDGQNPRRSEASAITFPERSRGPRVVSTVSSAVIGGSATRAARNRTIARSICLRETPSSDSLTPRA